MIYRGDDKKVWPARDSNPHAILTNLTRSEVSNVSFVQSSLILASAYDTIVTLKSHSYYIKKYLLIMPSNF